MSYPGGLIFPEPTNDIEQGKKNLEKFGVTIHTNLISEQKANELRLSLERLAEEDRAQGVANFAYGRSTEGGAILGKDFSQYMGKPLGLPPFQQVPLLAKKGTEFASLSCHPIILEYAEYILKTSDIHIGGEAGTIIRKGCPAQSIHTDQLPGLEDVQDAAGIITIIALSDFSEDMGATRFVPGSHTKTFDKNNPWKKKDSEKSITGGYAQVEPAIMLDPQKIPTVVATGKPGWAVLWDERVLHGRGAAISDLARCGYSICYRPDYIDDFYSDKIDPKTLEKFSDRQKKLYSRYT